MIDAAAAAGVGRYVKLFRARRPDRLPGRLRRRARPHRARTYRRPAYRARAAQAHLHDDQPARRRRQRPTGRGDLPARLQDQDRHDRPAGRRRRRRCRAHHRRPRRARLRADRPGRGDLRRGRRRAFDACSTHRRAVGFVPVPDGAALGQLVGAGDPEWYAAGVVAQFGLLRAGTQARRPRRRAACSPAASPARSAQFLGEHAAVFADSR